MCDICRYSTQISVCTFVPFTPWMPKGRVKRLVGANSVGPSTNSFKYKILSGIFFTPTTLTSQSLLHSLSISCLVSVCYSGTWYILTAHTEAPATKFNLNLLSTNPREKKVEALFDYFSTNISEWICRSQHAQASYKSCRDAMGPKSHPLVFWPH